MLQRDGFVGAVYFQALASCGREGSVESQPLRIPPESSILTKTFPGKVLRVPFLGQRYLNILFLDFFGSCVAGEIPGLPLTFPEAL